MLEADVEVDRREFTVRAALRVAPGERLALFGPSGAGKTTLLEVIAGLVQPRRGRVVLGGRVLTSTEPPRRAVPPWQRRVGLLRQDPGLFPHLSVRAQPALRAGRRTRPAPSWPSSPSTLGLGGLLAAMPARLSGGQAHRVALGRLLLAHCDALLLDEPYTGLDAGLRRALTELVVRAGRPSGPSRPCWSRTSWPRRRRSPTGWPSSTAGSLLQDGAARRGGAAARARAGSPSWSDTWVRAVRLAGRRGRTAASWPGVHPERRRRPAPTPTGARADRDGHRRPPVRGRLGGRPDRSRPATVTCRLRPARPARRRAELVVTALDPPCFGPRRAAAARARPATAGRST